MAGTSLGAVLIHLSALELLRLKNPTQRIALALVVLVAVAPSVLWLMQQTEAVYENTELRVDKRVASYIDDVPQDKSIATTLYPLRGTLNFMTDRSIAGGADIGQLLAAHQIVIIHEDETMPQFLPRDIARTPMPPYIVLSRKEGSSDE
jgi:hypothetical protein